MYLYIHVSRTYIMLSILSMLVNKKAFVIFRIQCPLAHFYQITIKSIVSYDNAIVCLKIYDTIIDWYNLCVVKSIKNDSICF